MKKQFLILSCGLCTVLFLNAQDQTINGATFKQDGKVGIGTTSPDRNLEVSENSNTDATVLRLTNMGWASHMSTSLEFRTGLLKTVPTSKISSIMNGSGNAGDRLGFFLQTNGANPNNNPLIERFSILPNGNVGIGTTTPASQFDVRTSDGKGVWINRDNQSAVTFSPNNGNSVFHLSHGHDNKFYISQGGSVGGGKLMTFVNTGNVGIGTTSPTGQLHISGTSAHKIRLTRGTGSSQIGMSNNTNNIFFDAGNDGSDLYINSNGNVGIGTTTPATIFDVSGRGMTLNRDSEYGQFIDLKRNNTLKWQIHAGISSNNDELSFRNSLQSSLMTIQQSGDVGIGTTDTQGFKLGVNGKIAATEVKVATYANWSDFVFGNTYNLPSLKEVEDYIKNNGHLENIPDAETVKKDGFFLAEMDAKLLQKIEELTLYTIEQEKEIDIQDQKIKSQNNRIEKLEKENQILKLLLERVQKLEESIKS